ncbi:hypothetical protein EDD85DRAFT_786357 [Armillaria nabsnona]|nr:hypothetical protein EDD85DRAFT_786357 [Armillaria nabsnona]
MPAPTTFADSGDGYVQDVTPTIHEKWPGHHVDERPAQNHIMGDGKRSYSGYLAFAMIIMHTSCTHWLFFSRVTDRSIRECLLLQLDDQISQMLLCCNNLNILSTQHAISHKSVIIGSDWCIKYKLSEEGSRCFDYRSPSFRMALWTRSGVVADISPGVLIFGSSGGSRG